MEEGLKDIVDFSANINPAGVPQGVKDAITACLDSCVNYPDPLYRNLRQAIGKYEKLDPQHIICGNGAADIIFRLVQALKPKKTLIPAPTFAEYEQALESSGNCKVDHFFLKEEEGFGLGEDYLQALQQAYDVAFLCNPNNPTGRVMDRDFLERVLEICENQGTLLVLDECFMDFVEGYESITMKGKIEQNHHLFILKAFTKSYAMPGIRLGYGLCAGSQLMEDIRRAGQPWSVSIPAQEAGIQALKEEEYLRSSMKVIQEEKKFLTRELEGLGIYFYPPGANYILLNIEKSRNYSVNTFKRQLRERGILIRDCGNYRGLKEGFYRIAVKDHQSNIRLVKALKDLSLRNK